MGPSPRVLMIREPSDFLHKKGGVTVFIGICLYYQKDTI